MKAIRLLVAASLIASPLSAQRSDLIIGMRSELTFAHLPGAAGFSSRPGYTFGPQIGFPLNKWFAIQTEILYTNIGSGTSVYSPYNQFGSPVGQFSYGAPASSQYLQIPVLARVSVGTIGPVTPVLYAGPMAQWMFSCTAGFNPYTGDGLGCGGQLAQPGVPASPYSGMSRWDVGGMVGAGFNFNFGDWIVVGSDLRYQRGIRQVSPIYPDFRNESVSLAFRLGAGSKLLPWGRTGNSDSPEDDVARFGSRPLSKRTTGTGIAPGVRM